MDFLKNLLKNLVFLIGLGILLLFLFPTQMKQVYEMLGALFGPLVILMIVAAALPRRRKTRD
jgi:hypothetical protein